MTDSFAEDEMPAGAELASAALDGELLEAEAPDAAGPEVASQLASFRALSAQLAAVDSAPPGSMDRAVAAALDAWANLDADRPNRASANVDRTLPLSKPHATGSLQSSPLRRQSHHRASRWTKPGVSALAVLAVIVLGVSALTRSNGTANNETATGATIDEGIKHSVDSAFSAQSATSLARSAEMQATTTVHRVSDSGLALDNSKLSSVQAQTEIQNYLNENASSLPASQPTGTATTTAPAELCGQQVAGLVDGPNGQIFLVDTTDQTGSRRITALDPATCVILAQLTVG